ncbi:MAG: M56 family metallopeptidase [Mobilitalea sp.]
MDKLFLTILNMSLTGTYVILGICLVRLPLKKAPKIISYCLWTVAGFRLIFPYSIESIFSLIPFKAQTIPSDIALQPIPRIESGILHLNSAVSSVLPAAATPNEANPLQLWITIGGQVWMLGVVIMLICGIMSFFILKQKMKVAIQIEENIYEAQNIKSPFVLGVFHPRIYLPSDLSAQERSYILLHEQIHIKRRDHLVKFVAYFAISLHWFNPLAWVAFLLMGVDMEMSCDERVLKEMGSEIKKDYSLSLISLATQRHFVSGSPLAFGEGGIKERIKNILNFKKPSRVIIIVSVMVMAALSVGFAVNRADKANDITGKEVYDFPDENFKQIFFQCNDTPYNPEYNSIHAQLMNNQNVQDLTCGSYFTLVKQVGDVWEIVPFADGVAFDDIAFEIEDGMSYDYSITPEMFSVKLDEGQYRIITDIYYQEIEVETPVKQTIRAEFTIDESAPKPEILDLSMPSETPMKIYTLENPTERQKMARLLFVNLYSDGTAWLKTPLISSYLLPKCTYSFVEGELLIYASIPTERSEGFFGVSDESIIARFEVIDDNTIVFKSANVPLFADEGARYVSVSNSITPISDFKSREWVDFYHDGQMSWTSTYDLILDEFPDVMFSWTAEKVTATDRNREKELFFGMPIWNVYLADLNGDNLPEFCATISFGSGIIDTRIIVYDYANDIHYEVSDRGIYDYVLSLENEQLVVTQTEYNNSVVRGVGSLAIIDFQLHLIGIDRTKPTTESD